MTGPTSADPVVRIGQLDARYPVALLPVRIETRFRDSDLLLRIYPDSILADSHEPLLTANEVAAGQDYWRRLFTGGPESDGWTALLGEARAERAAWIVTQTTPTNAARIGEGDAPQFPILQTRPENWHRAPQARALPERWLVSTYRGDERVHMAVSEPIQPGLALTPRLSADPGTTDADEVDLSGDGLRVDAALRWVYDFEEAVRVGMGLRIPLTPVDLEDGFSTVLVLGVRTSESAEKSATELEGLLDAHRYSRGLAFVKQGTRTNNTSDRPSDYPVPDPAGVVSLAVARGAPLATPGTDGARFAHALGIATATVDHVAGAERDEQSPAAAMIDALWPATMGYFLEQIFAPEVSGSTVDAMRTWMRDWVRPRGPLPALRVGQVPYGILPVSALSGWQPRRLEGVPAQLPDLLGRLAAIARTLTSAAPHVGRTTDLDRDLVELLGMDASTRRAKVRRSVGFDATWNAFGITGRDMTGLRRAQERFGEQLLTRLGEAGRDPRALYLTFTSRADNFGGPMVADVLSEIDPLAFDYVAWLRAASPDMLRQQGAPPEPVTALMYLMLRHALLTEYDRGARRLLEAHNLLAATEAREAELVGVLPDRLARGPLPTVRTAWERLDTRIADTTGTASIGEYLANPPPDAGAGRPPVAGLLGDLASYRENMAGLVGLPTAELDRLFTETLDASSHRLDAWHTSLATRRLASMRDGADGADGTSRGSWLGCYGWVVDLRPNPPGDRVEVRLADGSATLARTDSDGFVYAPSMLHAATAATLRSAYLSRSGGAQEPYAVDLSSRRVRAALSILDAVRDGQPLGAVLGYGFERGLHEGHPGIELDQFIDTFRGLWPAVANKAEASGESAESIAARNVVDGLGLLQAWQAGQIPWGVGELTLTDAQRAALRAELERLDDSVDAVADLLLSESVFQVLKGSPSGAAATLDTLARGHRPAEPEVVATPRGGTVLHQRVAVLFGDGTSPAGWAGIPATARSAMTPELDAWLAGLLGEPTRIECVVTPQGRAPQTVTLADLGLRPVDLLLVVQAAQSRPGSAELDRRIAWHVARDVGADTPVSIDYESAGPGAIALAAACEVMAAAGRVLGLGRPLRPEDLLPPGASTPVGPAPQAPNADLDGRADVLANAAMQALGRARTDLAAPDSASIAELRAALLGAAALGVPGAFPSSRHADSPATRAGLVDLARRVSADLDGRLAAANSATGAAAVISAVFGPELPLIPRFRPTQPEVVGPAIAAEPDLGADPDATVEGWFAQLARVRPPLDAWRDVQLYSHALGPGVGRPRIAQVPANATPRWAGLGFTDEASRPRSGLVSVALLGADPPPVDQPWAGLLLDSWPEILPSREEDAGVAFQYNAPGAQAPQAVLLAVPPDAAPTWSHDRLERILLDTLELAKIRALDLSDLGAFAQLVPMTFLAANRANATVSTSFTGLLHADATITLAGG